MIRGIILLILSCVVLTLADPYCTCNAHPEPLYEQSYNYYPTPTTKNIDYTVKPNPGHDLQEFYDKVNVPDHGFLNSITTGLLGGLLEVVEGLLAEVLLLVDELVQLLLGHQYESGIITGLIDGLLDEILGIGRGCRGSPICAVSYVEKLLLASTKLRQMEHTTQYLEKSKEAAESRAALLKAQQGIYGDYQTVSQEIDHRQAGCRGGNGGLLGGVGGGLLGGLGGGLLGGGQSSCDRVSILRGLLGLVGQIVGTVLNLVADLLYQLGIDIRNFFLALQISIHHLIQLDLIVDLFESITALDIYEDNLRQNHINPLMTQLQNNQYVPYGDIYRNLANIMADDQAKTHYMNMAGLPVRGYRFDNYEMTCRNSKGIDITLDLDIYLNLLNLVRLDLSAEVDLDIECLLSLYIDIDVDANVNVGTLEDGAYNYLDSLELVTMGMTGCPHVQTGLIGIDIDGIVSAILTIDGGLNHILTKPLIDINLEATIDLGGILSGVSTPYNSIISDCNGYKDIDSITSAIRNTEYQITQAQTKFTERNDYIESLIQDTHDMETAQTGYRADSLNKIETVDNPVQTARECLKVFTDDTKQDKQVYEVALENYKRMIDTTDARILNCQRDYLDAQLNLKQNPHDEVLIEIFAAAKLRLEDVLRELLYLKGLFLEVKAKIDLKLSIFDDHLLQLSLNIDARLQLLEAGIFELVENLDLNLIIGNILPLVLGVRDTITDLNIVPLGGVVDGVLNLLFDFNDRGYEGESIDHMKQMHQKIIQGTTCACAQNNNVYVTEAPAPHKRSASGAHSYQVTISNAAPKTTVAMATQENGMSATTTTTSSASSLVFSFLVLFVSVLCFF